MLLVACGGSSNGGTKEEAQTPIEEEPLPPLQSQLINLHAFESAITGIQYPIHIYLPPGYEDSEQTYPVIYATDGQWITEGFSRILEDLEKDIILVTIAQGPNNRRAIDYLLPGAHDYFAFLTSELLPYIESEYRIDGTNRTLQGASYGGLFVVLALFLDDVSAPTFNKYFAFDPSLFEHTSENYQLEQQRYNASQSLDATVVVTSASISGNVRWVDPFYTKLLSRNYDGLKTIRRSYNVHHNDVANPSFRDAVEQIF